MKKQLRRIIMIAAFLSLLPIHALAQELPEVQLPVSIACEGRGSSKENLTVILKAEEEECPMPDGHEGGSYRIHVPSDGVGKFPAITYKKVGVYHYEIWQEPGNRNHAAYDQAVYQAKVAISNKDDGGMEVTIVLYEKDHGVKSEDIRFVNRYWKSESSGSDDHDDPVYSDIGNGQEGSIEAAATSTEGTDSMTEETETGKSLSKSAEETSNTELVTIDENKVPIINWMLDTAKSFGLLPKTGDANNPSLWVFLMAVSGLGLISLLFTRRK